MALLLYKSNEMFSSTELIRKSKMIFNKVLDKEIEKAIILRDGKPSFLLMEFAKYEKIMAEYEELKEYVESLEDGTETKIKKPKKKIKKVDVELKKKLEEGAKALSMDGGDYSDLKEQKEIPQKEPETQPEVKEVISNPKNNQTTNVIKQPSEAQEIEQAIASIDAMDLDEETKQKGREKIRAKILEARKQREEEAKAQEQNLQEEDKEFEEQMQQVQEEKLKKEQELKEFWD